MPSTEATLAAKIDSSNLLGKEGEPIQRAAAPDRDLRRAPLAKQQPVKDEPEADEPEDLEEEPVDETEEAEDLEDDEQDQDDDEDGIDDPKLGRASPAARREIQALKEQIAELKGMIAGKKSAASTDGDGGAAAPSSSAAKTDKAFAKVREKLEAAKEEWGPLIEATGLGDLVEELASERDARMEQERKSQEEMEEQTYQQQLAAANTIHTGLNKVAKAHPDLIKIIGIGQVGTLAPKFEETRKRIIRAAIREIETAQDEVDSGQRDKPMSEADAVVAAIKRVTGKSVSTGSTPERKAADRARIARPYGGSSTSREGGKETAEQTESRLAAEADRFLATRR